ncbi:ribonuclease III domain-containing protein [Phlebopus sp. FC_14]|nr:ribonuclease III domain-containing protein [Phlebopus sp. FC_14]
MVKSKKGSAVHSALQDAVVAAINDPRYVFTLPALSDWESVVSCTAADKQRLEFVGDAVMHLSVALCLYQLFPDASPSLYTNIRSAVNTNATFTHLMVKTGAYQIPSWQSQPTKAVADSFEVIVAALYMEHGFAAVLAWVREQYAPLLAAARRSHDEHISPKEADSASSGSAKKFRSLPDSSSTHLLKTSKLSTRRSSPRRTMMARCVINGMKSKGLVKLRFPSKKPKLSLEKRLKCCEMSPAPLQRKGLQIIDLTLDDNTEDLSSTMVPSHQANPGTAFGPSPRSLAVATTSTSHLVRSISVRLLCTLHLSA